jgi:hypothetical protein
MNYLINKYRDWLLDVPDQTGDMITYVGYLSYLLALTGAVLTFSSGAYIPMTLCLGVAATIMFLVYIP